LTPLTELILARKKKKKSSSHTTSDKKPESASIAESSRAREKKRDEEETDAERRKRAKVDSDDEGDKEGAVKPKSSGGRQMTDAERKFEEIQRKRVSGVLPVHQTWPFQWGQSGHGDVVHAELGALEGEHEPVSDIRSLSMS
jgi:hypothetical protein